MLEARPPDPENVGDGTSRRLDPAQVKAERLSGGIAVVVLSILSMVGLIVLAFTSGLSLLALAAITFGVLALFVLLGWASFAWPPVEVRRISYRVDARGIEIKRGVIWRRVISVPRARIQHTDVSQGPVQRKFGLSTLVIHTAGTHNYEVNLEGLARPTALAIRDYLLEADGEHRG